MNYKEALEYVHKIPRFMRPLGNEKLSGLLGLLGNPHKKLKYIHVAGTNGKGSVCSMTAEILQHSGYKTGLFTSPFIEIFNERIRINGEFISDIDLSRYVTRVADVMEANDMQVSEFAFITAVAFCYFRDMKCDIVVLETGMGGRLDATNIIPTPIASVITSISLDHTAYLGDTIEEITNEKCGIIKANSFAVSAPNREVIDIIKNYAQSQNIRLAVADIPVSIPNGMRYKGEEYTLGLRGDYQRENAAVTIEVIDVLRQKGYDISEKAVADGLANASWIARYEFITPDIVIDGGHNPDGVAKLKKSLLSENRHIILIMAMCEDKNYSECIRDIAPIANSVVATELAMDRALRAEKIKDVCDGVGVKCEIVRDIKTAIERGIAISCGSLVCICGSLYLAGEARRFLKSRAKETTIANDTPSSNAEKA